MDSGYPSPPKKKKNELSSNKAQNAEADELGEEYKSEDELEDMMS